MITYGNYSSPKSLEFGFITEWVVSGDATARTITLPLVNSRAEGSLSYDCTVDWGDGSEISTIITFDDLNRIHTYTSDGTYKVNIKGVCEGWSFNNAGDKLKITRITNWGNLSYFNGFKYLANGFYGCTNLVSMGIGKILASGTGILTEGFQQTFRGCTNLTGAITAGLFDNHSNLTTNGFTQTFMQCSKINSIPSGLFDNHIGLTSNAFNATFYATGIASIPAHLFDNNVDVTNHAFNTTFYQCASLTAIPNDLFRYNTKVTIWAFNQTFRECPLITTIPIDLFRYNTLAGDYAFRDTFQSCPAITAIPEDLFRYNTEVAVHAFEGTFIGCTSITTIPIDLFRYNTKVSSGGFFVTFEGCSNLQTVPSGLFKYNTLVGLEGFKGVFKNCTKLQARADIFFDGGSEATRFINTISDFTEAFYRTSFSGTQGVAPELWDCSFPDVLELNVLPSTLWSAGDIITGQTSGVTSEVVGWFSQWKVLVKNVSGAYTDGEIIGVTGNASKLADQGVGYPIQSSGVIKTDCFDGAGNSLTSLSNYGDIPAAWI